MAMRPDDAPEIIPFILCWPLHASPPLHCGDATRVVRPWKGGWRAELSGAIVRFYHF
jgi:hypothetical protein